MTQFAGPPGAAIATTRFGLGALPDEIAQASTDPQGWLAAQIRPQGAPQPVTDDAMPLRSTAGAMADLVEYREAVKGAQKGDEERKLARQKLLEPTATDLLARTRLGALTSQSFAERWALFWSNHFTVSVSKSIELAALAPVFEREAIRPNVFGRFEELLVASSRHPAMLLYLDQTRSIGPNSRAGLRKAGGLNENLAREIMELHTLGADAGYSQADVTEFARALTGWSVGRDNTPGEPFGAFVFRANIHEPGPRQIFGRTYGEGEEEQGRRILADLAAHPKTADHIARKLAIHFVSDRPDPALTARLSQSFRRSHGDLAALARTLISAPEAWVPDAGKIKTPYELVVSSYRALGQAPRNFQREVRSPLVIMGNNPLAAPQPNGWSESGVEWAAPDALIKRLQWAQGFANYYTPQDDPVGIAKAALGARLRPETLSAVQRAESRKEAIALLIMSPEFQRR